MQLEINTEVLREGLGKILSVIDKKKTRPILTYALIEIDSNTFKISATDLEISSLIVLDCHSQEKRSFCVNAKNLYDIVKELPGTDVEILFESEENTLKLHSNDIQFSLHIYNSEEFPNLNFATKSNAFELSSKDILEIIQQTSHAISTDETRIHLNGIFFQEVDSKLRAVATDGHRLSLSEKQLTQEGIPALINGVIIPRKAVIELKKIAESNLDKILSFSIDESSLFVHCDERYFLSVSLISRDYPKYQAVIPSKTSFAFKTDKNMLCNAVKRIKIMSNEKSHGVKVNLKKEEMVISANHPGLGHATERIAIDYQGKDLEIGFNAKYLIDTLTTIEDGDISVELNNELSPVVIKSVSTPNYLGLIMPLKL